MDLVFPVKSISSFHAQAPQHPVSSVKTPVSQQDFCYSISVFLPCSTLFGNLTSFESKASFLAVSMTDYCHAFANNVNRGQRICILPRSSTILTGTRHTERRTSEVPRLGGFYNKWIKVFWAWCECKWITSGAVELYQVWTQNEKQSWEMLSTGDCTLLIYSTSFHHSRYKTEKRRFLCFDNYSSSPLNFIAQLTPWVAFFTPCVAQVYTKHLSNLIQDDWW